MTITMLGRVVPLLDRWIGLARTSPREEALAEERFRALGRQVPWLYAILLVNLVGVNVSYAGHGRGPLNLGNFLAVLLIARMIYWLRVRRRMPERSAIKGELRKTFLVCTLFCLAYSWWSLSWYQQSVGEARIPIVLFTSLAAVGCSFGLSAFPAAARIPMLILSVPMAVQLISEREGSPVGMGASILLLTVVTIRLISAHDEGFAKLVYSRFDIERERERATAAEGIANDEKARARQIADTDALTGIANRRALLAEVEALAQRGEGNTAVALIDLDGFKPINDTFGHEAGDSLLVEVSQRLQAVIPEGGLVARLGGDEFAMLFSCADPAAAHAVGETAIRRIGEAFVSAQRALCISACVGVSFHGADRADLRQALRRADIALYSAKRAGKGKVAFFTSALEAEIRRRTAIEQALREPAIQDRIDLAFQPIIDLTTMELTSFEALARWRHSELGWIAPSEFIPITERISVVEQISDDLLARAAAQAGRWPSSVSLSFNLSAVQLCTLSAAESIIGIIAEAGLEPSRLQIEVTETALLADLLVARRNLAHLRRHGVRILLDDFGAGYASISYLREIEFDGVKLDGTIIERASNGAGLPLLQGVVRLCDAMGLPCVAERIETNTELEMLRALGCRYGQGFGLARPMGADAAAHYARPESPRAKERGRAAA
jgi:diguanylate cyclase (GGDEF)-like protein